MPGRMSLAFLGTLLAVAFSSTPARAGCPTRFSRAELEAQVRGIEQAFPSNLETFDAQVNLVGAMIPCLGELVSPELAARIHRLVGVQAFLQSDWQFAEYAFAAARHLDPELQVFSLDGRRGEDLARAWTALSSDSPREDAVPAPATGSLYFDGSPALERPSLWPTLLQWVAEDGMVLRNQYLWPGQEPFTYPLKGDVAPRAGEASAAAGEPAAVGKGAAPEETGSGRVQPGSGQRPPVPGSTPQAAEPASPSPAPGSTASGQALGEQQVGRDEPPPTFARAAWLASGVCVALAGTSYVLARSSAESYGPELAPEQREARLRLNELGAAGTYAFGALAVGGAVLGTVSWLW